MKTNLVLALLFVTVGHSFATNPTYALYRNRSTGKVVIDIISPTSAVSATINVKQPIFTDLTSIVVGRPLFSQEHPDSRYDVTFISPTLPPGHQKSLELDENGKVVFFLGNTNRGPLVGIGDFNGNGEGELIYHDLTFDRYRGIEFGGSFSLTTSGVTPGTYNDPIGVCDADGDGHPDIVFRDPATNKVKAMYFSGRTATSMQATAFDPTPYMPSGWKIVGVADVDGNGTPDIFIRGGNAAEPVEVLFRSGNTVTKIKKLAGSTTRDRLAIGQG